MHWKPTNLSPPQAFYQRVIHNQARPSDRFRKEKTYARPLMANIEGENGRATMEGYVTRSQGRGVLVGTCRRR